MLVKGDKIRLVENIGDFDRVGSIFTITDISDNGTITFLSDFGMGCMSYDEFEGHFEKYIEEPQTLEEIVSELLVRIDDLEDRVETLENEDY